MTDRILESGSGAANMLASGHAMAQVSGKAKSDSDTVASFETDDLTRVGIATQTPLADRTSKRTAGEIPESSGQAVPPLVRVAVQSDEDADPDSLDWQKRAWRGAPSWLTSMIFHLSVILLLALLTVSSGGRKIIALLGTETENVSIEPVVTLDVPLSDVHMDSLSEPLETDLNSQAMENLEPVLDSSLLYSSLDSDSSSDIFQTIAKDGIAEGDVPPKEATVGAKFFGVEGDGANFVFIVDCSGSMADYGRWNRAVSELKKSIEELKPNQKFLILLYNDGVVSMNNQTELVPSTTQQKKKAFKWLSMNYPDSMTFCAQALRAALSLQPDAIFLLSDGEFNDRMEVFEVLDRLNSRKQLARYEKKPIPVHTIALGSHLGRFTMERIADENSGVFKLIE